MYAGDRVLVSFAQVLGRPDSPRRHGARLCGDAFVAFIACVDGESDRFLLALTTAIAGSDLPSLASMRRMADLPVPA